MQLIWVAGPAAQVVTVSITARKVLMALFAVSSFLLILGFVFNFVGLRVAIEYAPELAHRMGGVTSQTEQMKTEALYRTKLDSLNQQLGLVTRQLGEMERIKNDVLGRLGVEKLLPVSGAPKSNNSWGRGGPLNLLPVWGSKTLLSQQLDATEELLVQYEKILSNMQANWQKDLDRLDLVPTQLPLSGEFLLTSSFGVRADPMTHLPSMHEGIDFVAPVGTPVLATAPGQVLRAEYSGAYGNMVEVSHQDGFVTRYAHLKTIFVKPGQFIRREETLGTLGNTGRSTGPHLHYEVLLRGQPMHPAKALAAWSRHSVQ
ncbi:M23 family metallopeptidase [Limnohabitans sp. 2KL-3]|uniref:M23 family metallopeptidase n=1 Tax=Limnohabitans sp. 2KL-3 TaxID=1100700 RepID=UPI000AE7A12C|nr:M23 family metallopeptidase [Limnohabitans sp. 2KL-3]